MKKLLLFAIILSTMQVGATIYLVENGTGGRTWRTAGVGEENVVLSIQGKSLTEWLSSKTWSTTDQIWIAGGTYNVATEWTIPSPVAGYMYGGFSGSESSIAERQHGINAWDYSYETILHATAAVRLFNAGGDRTITFDGLTMDGFTNAVFQRGNMHIQNCKFTNNTGSAVSFYNGTANASVINSYFYNNTITGTLTNGSAMTVAAATSLTYSIDGCLFENNSSTSTGNSSSGAIRIAAGTGGTFTCNISSSIFKNNRNTATSGTGRSSVLTIYSNLPTVNMTNCIAYGDVTSPSNIDAIYMLKGNITNCTFVNHYKGAYIPASGTVNLKNTVFWGVEEGLALLNPGGIATAGTTSNITLDNCAYRTIGTVNANNNPIVLPNSTNTSGANAPFFTDPANNIWTLQTGSSLLNSGTATGAPASDIIGIVRSSYDIGAYEAIQSSVNASGLTLNTYSDISILNGGELTFDANKNINSIAIGSGGKVSLNSGNSLTAAKASIFSDATNGTGTFVDNNPAGGLTVTETTSVQQYLSGGGRAWWYLASPTAAASSSIFGSDKVGKHVEDYLSDDNEATTTPYFTSPFSTPENLTPGRGYMLKKANTADGAIYTFTGGALNSGTISPTVTRTGTTAGARGFNLVGNPYPSYIDWDEVYADATHLRNAVWFRTYNGSQMVFHTYGDGDAVPEITSPTIAPMQAFWVKVDADGNTGTLTFKNSHRSHFTTGANQLKVKASDNRQRLRLVISNETSQDETLVVGKSHALDDRDSYDIEKMTNNNPEIPEIYSSVGNEELVINAMQSINEGTTFALGIRPGKAGSFTITTTQLENISGQVVLVDQLNGTETELTEGSSYSFSSDGTATNDRFSVEVRVPGALTSVDTSSIKTLSVYNLNNSILISGIKAGEKIRIFNSMGQLLQNFTASGDRTELQHTFSPGVYLIKVNHQSGKFTVR